MSTTIKPHLPTRRRLHSTRVNLRINPGIKALLVQAAKLRRIKLTEFMVRSSREAAETALAERTRFLLSPEKWREFNAALDSGAHDIPALRKLFSERSPFDSA